MISICIVIGSARRGIAALHAAVVAPPPSHLCQCAAAVAATAPMPAVFLLCER